MTRVTSHSMATVDDLLAALDRLASTRADARRLQESDLLAQRWDTDKIDTMLEQARTADTVAARELVIQVVRAIARHDRDAEMAAMEARLARAEGLQARQLEEMSALARKAIQTARECMEAANDDRGRKSAAPTDDGGAVAGSRIQGAHVQGASPALTITHRRHRPAG